MNKHLFKAPQYCLITFATTSYALKAERILKAAEADFIMIPTLREISSSCGLSIKFLPEQLDEYAAELEKGKYLLSRFIMYKRSASAIPLKTRTAITIVIRRCRAVFRTASDRQKG